MTRRGTQSLHAESLAIAELARAGRHEQAVQAASTALAAPGSAAQRCRLLDLRAESLMAMGDLDRALADAQAMRALATRSAKLRAQALCCLAGVHIRRGEIEPTLEVAQAALEAARASRSPALMGLAELRMGDAQHRGFTRQDLALELSLIHI